MTEHETLRIAVPDEPSPLPRWMRSLLIAQAVLLAVTGIAVILLFSAEQQEVAEIRRLIVQEQEIADQRTAARNRQFCVLAEQAETNAVAAGAEPSELLGAARLALGCPRPGAPLISPDRDAGAAGE